MDPRSKRKLTFLKDLLKEGGVTGKIREIVQEEVNSNVFWETHKIIADKHLRQAIINLDESTDGRLKYIDFQKALSFLSIRQDRTLKVRKFTSSDKLKHLVFCVISFIYLSFAALSLIIFFFPLNNPGIQLALLLMASLFFILACFFKSQTFPLQAARKIKNEIRKIRRQSFYS